MPAKRSLGTTQSLTFIGALLVTTAFTVPAYAQIETVVVTAEKKAEDIQSVPIAVTAYSAQDLSAHQVNGFKDIQFSTPNVSYTKTNFTGSNFQIRGIGTQVISGDAESGIAFNIDDVYYSAPPVDSGQFYDLERVEILRGPQSTLYGRGATGGTVNVFSAKPKLDEFAASIDASYGTYDSTEIKGMVNMPIVTDQLAVRVAADWVHHDGYATNIDPNAGNSHPDSRDQWSGRALVRWQPTQDTTVDLIYSHSAEDDTRMRGEKQLCHTDPTGVLGCLPDALDDQPVNLNATFLNIPISYQAAAGAFSSANPPLGGFLQSYENPYPPYAFGLYNLAAPYNAPPGAVPSGPRTINSDFNPTTHEISNAATVEVKQKVSSWLDGVFVANYDDGVALTQESYTNSPGAAFDPVALATSQAALQNTLNNFVSGAGIFGPIAPPQYADLVNGPYAFMFAHPGELPTSNFTGLGIVSHNINRYTANEFAYDQSDGGTKQFSADLRFNTNFEGPLNFMLAAYYLNTVTRAGYYVGSNTLDYGQMLLGALFGPIANAATGGGLPACLDPGCIYGPPYYHNDTNRSTVESKAIYGEAYYDAIPDSLKFTLGLRGTEDIKDDRGRIAILNSLIPIGTTSEDRFLAISGVDFDPTVSGIQPWEETHRKFDKLTGRLVVDYNPHWDLTDSTNFYASYSRGYKAGGSNPGVQPGNVTVPATYEPESIDAYEVGAKNTLLDGRLQANLTAWYYNYGGYQISSIISNTSVNTNITAFLNGLEGEFLWAPDDHWQFSLNADWTQSRIGNSAQIDTRNPGGGVSYAVVIKDATLSVTNAQNCVIYHNDPGAGNLTADFGTLGVYTAGAFFQPPGGITSLNSYGVPNAAYGLCNTAVFDSLIAQGIPGFSKDADGTYHLPGHFSTADATTGGTFTGVPVNIHGNELANTPPYSLSFGAQYSTAVGGGYNLVSRVDYFWQAPSWGRIFNSPADAIASYGVMNALLTLNAPDNAWYVQAYAKNLLGGSHVTGQYLTSSSSGLWTGVFYGDPRVIGATVGARF